MSEKITRRDFSKTVATGIGVAAATSAVPGPLMAQSGRRLRIGHTGITWGFAPKDAEKAITDVGSLGYWGYESFGNVLEAWDTTYGLERVLAANKIGLRSAYCPVNLTSADGRAAEVAKLVKWANLIKKLGGGIAVIGPNSVNRATYRYADNKTNIVAALNDLGKACMDVGIVPVLHQHTGTCVESRDETYATVEAMDTRVMKFGPDVGQLQKGGSDPVKVCTDFHAIIHHVHMKDFDGGPDWLGYCPLGQGKVNVEALVDIFEKAGNDMMIMVELDPNDPDPATGVKKPEPLQPIETAKIAKEYLHKLGYAFRV
jgi:inosose dehydratase